MSSNPYLQSRSFWNDMYGSVQIKLQNAYRIILILAVVVVVLALGLVVISGRSQIKPYLAVLKGHEVLTVKEFSSPDFESLQGKLAIILSEQFLFHARRMSVDKEVNRHNRIQALSMTSNQASQVLRDYFVTQDKQQNNNLSRQVSPHGFLLKSPHTLEVRWQEIIRDSRSGEIVSQGDFAAEMSFMFSEQTISEQQRTLNPLGFYITHLTWAKDFLQEDNHHETT